MAYSLEAVWGLKRLRLSDGMFFFCAAVLLSALVSLFSLASLWFMQNVYLLGDTRIFYAMADVIVQGRVPYVDYQDSKPPLIYFTLALPALADQRLPGGLVLVGAFDLASALLVTAMGWKLYGRLAGLVAGGLFALNLAWAEGYFILAEPFALAFLLASAYALAFSGRGHRYLVSGICAGIAIGFKQYALLILPATFAYLYWKGELKHAPVFLVGVLAPLGVTFGAVFLGYGTDAGLAALYWSFSLAPEYLAQGYSGEFTGYSLSGPRMLVANVLIGGVTFIPISAYAALSFFSKKATAQESYLFLAALLFASTILVRPFLHYWALALPFIVLLCVGRFGDRSGP